MILVFIVLFVVLSRHFLIISLYLVNIVFTKQLFVPKVYVEECDV